MLPRLFLFFFAEFLIARPNGSSLLGTEALQQFE